MSLENIFEDMEGFFPVEEISKGVYKEIISPEQVSEGRETTESLVREDGIVGTPEQDALLWHWQEHECSCAVVCQEFIAEGLLGEEYSEARMRAYGEAHGLFRESGTYVEDVGKLLEHMGLEVTREFGCTEKDLLQVLSQGGKVIVGVNACALSHPMYGKRPGVRADHAVQVTGLDYSNPGKVSVILNDPGVREGAGRTLKLKDFLNAWDASGRFMVSVFR